MTLTPHPSLNCKWRRGRPFLMWLLVFAYLDDHFYCLRDHFQLLVHLSRGWYLPIDSFTHRRVGNFKSWNDENWVFVVKYRTWYSTQLKLGRLQFSDIKRNEWIVRIRSRPLQLESLLLGLSKGDFFLADIQLIMCLICLLLLSLAQPRSSFSVLPLAPHCRFSDTHNGRPRLLTFDEIHNY